MLAETVTQVMDNLDERGRRVFELAMQGYSVDEISAEIGRTERMVYRKLKDIRSILEGLQAEE